MYIIRTYCFRSMQQREVIYIIRTFSLPELVQTIHFDEIIDEMVVENSLCSGACVVCCKRNIPFLFVDMCVCLNDNNKKET